MIKNTVSFFVAVSLALILYVPVAILIGAVDFVRMDILAGNADADAAYDFGRGASLILVIIWGIRMDDAIRTVWK